jgi:hypothetical protein
MNKIVCGNCGKEQPEGINIREDRCDCGFPNFYVDQDLTVDEKGNAFCNTCGEEVDSTGIGDTIDGLLYDYLYCQGCNKGYEIVGG